MARLGSVGVSVSAEGFDAAIAALGGLSGESLSGELEAPVDAAASLFEGAARGYAAVDTGFMRDNITHETVSAGNGAMGVVTSAAHYSWYVEFGTSNEDGSPRTQPQPFMTPAYEENLSAATEILIEGAKAAIMAAIKG